MDELALFDVPERTGLPPDELAGLSADRRRTLRHRQMVDAGVHPLTRRRARPDLGTCGGCRFRTPIYHHNRTYPKCAHGGYALASHSAATDVRAWWPACEWYEPKRRRPVVTVELPPEVPA